MVKTFHALFIGPPGVGKGTICDRLREKIDYEHISTGDLVRAEIKNGTEVGKQIKEISEKGGLVSDDIICKILVDHLKKVPADKSWILDGFPRTEVQAKFLKESEDLKITHVIELVGDEKFITERLSGRLFDPVTGSTYHKVNVPPPAEVAARCITRKDDQPEAIAQRFVQYRNQAGAIRQVFGDLMVVLDTAVIGCDGAQQKVFEMLLE